MEVLVEIHSYYQQQIEIAKKVDFVYDFALPPLILHAIYNQTGEYLKKWLDISPRNCITVLDTHDGIGVIDIGPHSLDKSLPGLVPNEDIDRLVEEMHERSGGQSRQATGEAASNLDLYQVNSTYYDVLARNDDHYLMARAIQFFAPGIPQVYYTGFLAEPNDLDLLARTNVGRDINRHYFRDEEAVEASKRPVVQRLIKLIRWRNHHPAFSTGQFEIQTSSDKWFMTWAATHSAQLEINWSELSFSIHYQTEESEGWVNLEL
ncbi:MAG: sucrose phosphorylase, partial [Bacteroidota bacterium]